MPSTYAFKAVVGSMFDPDVGSFPFQGQQGVKQITITNATERTAHDTAADGTIMVSYVSGASGACDIETQQTSALHQFLVNWANVKFTQSENMDAARFAAASIKVVDTVNGAVHTLTGCSPAKIPDKPYGPAGGFCTWRIMCANVVSQ